MKNKRQFLYLEFSHCNNGNIILYIVYWNKYLIETAQTLFRDNWPIPNDNLQIQNGNMNKQHICVKSKVLFG